MNVSEAVLNRRTVRGYKPDPVPDEVLNKILETAQRAPSNCNTQPWHIAIVSGEARNALEALLTSEISAGLKPAPDFAEGATMFDGVYQDRQIDCAIRYYSVAGINRRDREARTALMMKNFEFFGAPHVAFLSMPRTMGPVNAVDVGIYLQTLMLLMVEHGLGSCPQGALAYYSGLVRQQVDIPADNGILCGLSFGYEDTDALLNSTTMDRVPLADTVIQVS